MGGRRWRRPIHTGARPRPAFKVRLGVQAHRSTTTLSRRRYSKKERENQGGPRRSPARRTSSFVFRRILAMPPSREGRGTGPTPAEAIGLWTRASGTAADWRGLGGGTREGGGGWPSRAEGGDEPGNGLALPPWETVGAPAPGGRGRDRMEDREIGWQLLVRERLRGKARSSLTRATDGGKARPPLSELQMITKEESGGRQEDG